MGLFDVHAHLTNTRLVRDRAGVLSRARAAGVTTIISNGLDPIDNEAVRSLAQAEPLVQPAFGLYPVQAVLPEMRAAGIEYPHEGPAQDGEECVEWVAEHVDSCFAVGEIGLDGYWVPEEFWERQEQLFRQLVTIAMNADRAIIIHTRKRERRTLEILDELGATRVNWHCFGGKLKLARSAAERGHYLSIPANARRAQNFTRMLEKLPREQLLLETDCPYLPPDRGADPENPPASEPAQVSGTADYAAELWKCARSEVDAQMEENFEKLFGVAP